MPSSPSSSTTPDLRTLASRASTSTEHIRNRCRDRHNKTSGQRRRCRTESRRQGRRRFIISMARTKMKSNEEDTRGETGRHADWRAQTSSYRKSNELGQTSDELGKGSVAHASDVQGREISVHKALVPPVKSFSSKSNEEDMEQVVTEEDSS
ncbi:hypothetical protein Syun_020690 [Stephania yunnanensis]|uniref:Uncharacterized protein n=1 Tax=Stephania yunnanensis TaxID=152371 RepID=A0AAP0IED4_9MAGN